MAFRLENFLGSNKNILAGVKSAPAPAPAPAPPAPINKDPFANLIANLGVKNSPLPTLQVKDSWDSAKASEFLITSADMRELTGNVNFGVGAMSNLIKNKITPLSELVDRNYIVDATKYPTVYITSDIHSDVRKFIQMLQGAGLLDLGSLNNIYKLDTIYEPALFDQIEWTGGTGTLLVIVGDLVDGKRIAKTHINDPKGSFEFLLHALLYNLKIKALNAESDIRFTIGNHDFHTVIEENSSSPNIFRDYVTEKTKDFFNKDYKTRRNALLPFYKVSPFYLLSIELGGQRQVACVHGGLHSIIEYGYSGRIDVTDYTKDIRNLQEKLFTPGGAENFFPGEAMGILPKSRVGEQPGPLWSRSYAESVSDKHCAEIAKTGYKLVVVGHCPTNSGFSRTEAVMSGDKVAYAGCEHSSFAPVGDGCVILDCIHSNGKPQLAFVDVALSYGFRTQNQIDDLQLKNNTQNPDGNRMRTVEILKLTNVNTTSFTIERKKIVVDVASLTPTMSGGRSRSKRTQRKSKKNASRKRRLRGTSRSLRKRSHSRQRR